MKKSYALALTIALLAAGWIASGRFSEPQSRQTESRQASPKIEKLSMVRVHLSRARQKRKEIILLGRTQAWRKIALRAETAGRVIAIGARAGRKLRAGEVILRLALDDRPARRAEAEALLAQRRLEFQVAQDLSARKFRSATKLAEADAKLQAAKAALASIRLDVARTTIRAPFAGILESRPVEIGDYLSVGALVATLIDLTPIRIVGHVTEREVEAIRLGVPARARLASGRELAGRISFVASVGEARTRTFKVEMEAENTDGAVREGLTAELHLDLGSVQAHLVSPAVLTLSESGVIGVKSVGPDDRVRFHPVRLIDDGRDGMWLGGLPDKIKLITVGQEFVRTGQRVKPVPDQAVPLSSRRRTAL